MSLGRQKTFLGNFSYEPPQNQWDNARQWGHQIIDSTRRWRCWQMELIVKTKTRQLIY